jgi:hypothetical protein
MKNIYEITLPFQSARRVVLFDSYELVQRIIYFRSRFNAIRNVLVGPFNWGSTLIIGADVTHDFAIQIGDRSEDAAGDNVSLDF